MKNKAMIKRSLTLLLALILAAVTFGCSSPAVPLPDRSLRKWILFLDG